MVNDLQEYIAKQVTLSKGTTGRIRVFEISKDGKHQKECLGTEMLGNLADVEFYAEVCLILVML
jgi:ubiquitin carboxyl-terminal hydrolase 7